MQSLMDAGKIGAFYRELVSQGIDRADARDITIAYLMKVLNTTNVFP